jgi:hypothetical protein
MKNLKLFKSAFIAAALLGLPLLAAAQTVLPEVIVRCTRYSGSFSFGDHYVEWIMVICDNPEANNFWIETFHAA